MQLTKSYTWDAKDYASNSQNQFQWAQERLSKLKLGGSEAVLDIGCGDGKITAQIAKSLPNGKAVGIDSSPQMVNLAASSFPKEQYPNLSFQLMDAKKLTFTSEFDVVFSNAALHWILDQKSVLLGVRRCLNVQGRLLFQMAGKGNAQSVLDIFDELLNTVRWQRYFKDFKFPYAFLAPEEFKVLLKEAGLEPLRVEFFGKDMKFAGAEGLAGWVRTTWLPFTECVPIEHRGDFVEEIASRYLKRCPADGEGIVHLGMMRLEVEAKKP